MFHYINWRPTDVTRKHSLPSETEFFLKNKEGNITPPPPQPKTKKPYQDCPNGAYLPTSYTTTATNLTTPNLTTPSFVSEHQRNKQLHQEKPPQDDFFWSQTSPKTRRFFSRVPDVTRSRRPVFFGCRRHQEMIARGSRRHLRSPFPA